MTAIVEGAAAAQRVLTKLRHDPQALAVSLAGPVVMVLIFGYVFGSAIAAPGTGQYREYLVPGLFVTIAGNVLPAMVQMARDAGRGVVDRFLSMPVSRAAVPFGQAAATLVYGLASLLLMSLCGLLVGWRLHGGPAAAVQALLLLLLLQFAITWLGMYLGLLIGSEEAAAQLSVLVFPLSMISNIFVPTSGMPTWLRTAADWNPLSAAATAVRDLFGNPNAPTDGAWPLEHATTATLLWSAVILAVFVPLTARGYARPR